MNRLRFILSAIFILLCVLVTVLARVFMWWEFSWPSFIWGLFVVFYTDFSRELIKKHKTK